MNGPALEIVRLVREAHGAACRDCGAVFNVSTCPYWAWTKSVGLHHATGHRIDLYRIVA